MKFKPSVSRHNLLFIAAIAWLTAGGILSGRGLSYVTAFSHYPAFRTILAMLTGCVFYVLLFAKISGRHIRRIHGLNIPYPCAFSFFNIRGYLMMALMITSGILLRRSGLLDIEWLSTFYIVMGTPLLISSARFFYYWYTKKAIP